MSDDDTQSTSHYDSRSLQFFILFYFFSVFYSLCSYGRQKRENGHFIEKVVKERKTRVQEKCKCLSKRFSAWLVWWGDVGVCATLASLSRRKNKRQTSLRNLCRLLETVTSLAGRRLFEAASSTRLKVSWLFRTWILILDFAQCVVFFFFKQSTCFCMPVDVFQFVITKKTKPRWSWDVCDLVWLSKYNPMLLLINAYFFLYVFFITKEEDAEVKKSKFYQPAAKFVPVSPHVAAVSSSESKKSVRLFLICPMASYLVSKCCCSMEIQFTKGQIVLKKKKDSGVRCQKKDFAK